MPSVDSRWVGWAQWLALLTMTLDHLVRHLLGPESALAWWPESLGRLAFPLFAAMVAWHGCFTSRDALRYARRILLIGVLAQLPYALMPRPEAPYLLNVCFTLSAGLVWAHWARGALAKREERLPWVGLALSLGLWWALGFWVEFGHAGLVLVPALMLALGNRGAPPSERLAATPPALTRREAAWAERLAAILPALVVVALLNPGLQASAFALAGVWLAWAMAGARLPRVPWPMPRWLWRAWYPGHFALLALLLWPAR